MSANEEGGGERSPVVLVAILLLAVLAAMVVPQARAAFPGRNGRIVVQDPGGGTPPGVGGPAAGGGSPSSLVEALSVNFASPQLDLQITAACGDPGFAFPGLDSGFPSCEPAYSPSGKAIVFDAGGRIGLIDADGRHERELPPLPVPANPHAGTALEPTFSPDGRRVLFAWHGHLFTERLDGTSLREIAIGRLRGAGATSPAWSARGLIAFVYRKNIFVVKSNGHGLRQVTESGAADPAFSPNGRRLAFTRPVTGVDSPQYPYRIFIIGVDGRTLRPLRGISSGPSIMPAWSPDGHWIAFETGSQGGGGLIDPTIEQVRTNGRGLRSVYNGGTYDTLGGPDWQPLPR